MKLRVALMNSRTRMEGVFVVQVRRWGRWYDMYFNNKTQTLKLTMELGEGALIKAFFDDWATAVEYARAFKESGCNKQKIRKTWKV